MINPYHNHILIIIISKLDNPTNHNHYHGQTQVCQNQIMIMINGFGSKPDLVVISRSSKRIALFELTCPLERNIHTANTYKRDKYSGMQGDLEDKGWKVHLVPYEVSSRGQILKNTKSSIITTLKHFKIKIKAEQLMFKQLSKIALLSTFSIFHAYQTKEWVSPPLLKP